MTTYVVLQLNEESVGGDQPGVWTEVTDVDARDDKHAIQQATSEAGTYVAVPRRSWKPRTRQVETVVKDIWS